MILIKIILVLLTPICVLPVWVLGLCYAIFLWFRECAGFTSELLYHIVNLEVNEDE